jgi:hypothetical protein
MGSDLGPLEVDTMGSEEGYPFWLMGAALSGYRHRVRIGKATDAARRNTARPRP